MLAMSAEALFSDLKARNWVVVDEWLANGEPESLQLEFKLRKGPKKTASEIEVDDRESCAKAISGLANTSGGVLVLGVHARAAAKGECDRVENVVEILELGKYAGLVERLVATFTDPPVSGLEVLALENPSKPDAGLVAILVPASDGGPHRAINASTGVNDRYFMRTASATLPMPHPLLADRFGRRAQPQLQLIARFGEIGPQSVLSIKMSVRNDGRGGARCIAVEFDTPDPIFNWNPDGRQRTTGWTVHAASFGPTSKVICEARQDLILYPGMERTLLGLSDVGARPVMARDWRIRLKGTLYALDAEPRRFDGELVATQGDSVEKLSAQRLETP